MNEPRHHRLPLRIAAAHPALPGHFPGAPVVPGVVLLDAVLAAAGACLGSPPRVRELVRAKFVAPLLPETEATIVLDLGDGALAFRVERDGALLAEGRFTLEDRR